MTSEKVNLVRYACVDGARWGALSKDETRVLEIVGDVYTDWETGEEAGLVADLKLLPPCEPKTISALAFNYKDLVGERDEYDEPLVFLKAVSTLASATDNVVIPAHVDRIWAEVEIALVLKTDLYMATREEAEAAILGVTVANDITAKNVHGRDHHLARSKSGFTFCPVSPVLRQWDGDRNYRMRTTINGRQTQNGVSSNRILDDIGALMLISSIFPLAAGDIVLTGTPAGAMDSIFSPGDDVRLEVEGLGFLNNPVIARS